MPTPILAHGATEGADAVGVVSTGLIVAAGLVYLVAARRPSRAGRRWPTGAVTAYLCGLVLLYVVSFSGMGGSDHSLAVHVARHLVLMMVVAPLLVAGGPLRLLLRSLPRDRRMSLVGIVQDPAVRAVTAGRWTAVLLTADYYGSMAVYLLTPLARWATEHLWLHVAAHVYFLACGALFWAPLLGRDPTGWRPRHRTKLAMTLAGVPLNALLGWILIVAGVDEAAGWVLILGGGGISLLGVAVVALQEDHGVPGAKTSTEGVRWPAAS